MDKDITDWTVKQLQDFIKDSTVPDNAVIEYEGCGSHRVCLTWTAPSPAIETIVEW